jgi:tRNA (mo5U34)-methyltransferase
MLNTDAVLAGLAAAGLAHWQAPLRHSLAGALHDGAHGKLGDWNALLRQLPEVRTATPFLDQAAIGVAALDCDKETREMLRELLLRLVPWRKGPFHLCGIDIDSEWRSDMKWSRIEKAMSPLRDRLVLDVGCGNGYYALRMRGSGARFVLGIEPTLQYLAQFHAAQRYIKEPAVHVLPLRLAELPDESRAFDSTFSMGVLYHQRDPLRHLQQLRGTLRGGGELVLETLILPGDHREAITPPDRYARMRNVWSLPTLSQLQAWIAESGFAACAVADVSVTTVDEQRRTAWMPFESLQGSLDPGNPELTIEGLPRPRRAVLVARVET